MRRPLEAFAAGALAVITLSAPAPQCAAEPGTLQFERVSVEHSLSYGAVWPTNSGLLSTDSILDIAEDSIGIPGLGPYVGLDQHNPASERYFADPSATDSHRPPPWKTRWAYSLYALMLAAAVAGYLRQQRREVEHERAINRRLQAADAAREQLIRELAAKNAELKRFTYTVSHDLKTPLVTIQGFLSFIKRDAAAGNLERLDEDISRIDGAVGKMRELLENLLDLSRVGRVMNAPERVALGDLFVEARELLAGTIAERGAEILIADDLPVVVGHRTRLFQVAQNLLENAIKYSDGPPRIEVGMNAALPSGDPVVFIRDQGIGIEAKHLEAIFGLFQQLDSDHPGTGIGLALVKRIVEVHDGRIWVESEGPGTGSTFFLSLPRAQGAFARSANAT